MAHTDKDKFEQGAYKPVPTDHAGDTQKSYSLPPKPTWGQLQQSKFMSRKFLGFLIVMSGATFLTYIGRMDGDAWGLAAVAAMGSYQYFSWRAKKDGVD